MENNQLNLMYLLKKKNKVYYLISKKKYSIMMLPKELDELKYYSIILNLKI